MHTLPQDVRTAIFSSDAARATWNDITPLARNEWICWAVSVKKLETRRDHIKRLRADLIKGKRRPCCWAGCPHR